MNILVDTNVLLDVLVRREPFYADSSAVWTLAERGSLKAFVSALSFPNVFYILGRGKGRPGAREAMAILRDVFGVVPLDAQILNQALDAGMDDVEDAIQYFSAVRAGAQCLVTRNPGHFPAGDLPIQTPAEFLAANYAE